MALFGSKKKKEVSNPPAGGKVKETKKTTPVVKRVAAKMPQASVKVKGTGQFSSVLEQPRITEKATMKAEIGVYVFEVNPTATKKEIGSAVMYYYNVTPVKVNIVKIPTKKKVSRTTRKTGIRKGGKKAYVFLKKEDKIEII